MATRQSVREFGDSLAFLIQALVRANQEAKMKREADQQFRGAFNQKPVMAPSSTVNVGGMPAQLQRFQGVESQPNYQLLAQLRASSNPLLAQKSQNFLAGQKALQGLQPEYRVGGGAEAGYFQYDPRNPAKSMQQLTPPRPQSPPGMTPYQEQSLKQRKDEFEWNKNKPAENTSAIELRIRTLEDDIEKAEREAQEAELKMSALESGVDPILKYDRNNPTKSSGYQMYTVLGSTRLANLDKIKKKRKELEALQSGASLKRPVGSSGAVAPGAKGAPMEYDYVPGKGLVPRGR